MPLGASRAGLMSVAKDEIPDSVVYQLNSLEIEANEGESLSGWEDNITEDTVDAVGSPTYRDSSINDNPGVELDGTDDAFVESSFSDVPKPQTLFILLDLNNVNHQGWITGRVESLNSNFVRIDDENVDVGLDGSTALTSSISAGVRLISARMADSDTVLRVDGVEEDTDSSTDAGPLECLSYGFEAENNRRYVDGTLGILEIHDEALTDEEIQSREDEIASMFDHSM